MLKIYQYKQMPPKIAEFFGRKNGPLRKWHLKSVNASGYVFGKSSVRLVKRFSVFQRVS